MAYVGYIVLGGAEGKPVAAGLDYNETLSLTFTRLCEQLGRDFWAMHDSAISVQERDLTDEQVAEFERIVAEVTEKHRAADAGREALK